MIDWHNIDTVMLDMDGTLLDLHYDNYFWLHYLPRRYAEIHKLEPDEATAKLHAVIDEHRGTLQWYCLDYWSDKLALDIRSLKEEVQHKIAIRPHVENWLARLREHDKQLLLVTNAHRKVLSLKLEITGIDQYLDEIFSSHDFQHPKEDQAFWHALQSARPFQRERTLFVDDTATVLESAKTYGIRHLLGIHQPDSQVERRLEGYPAIHHFDEVMPAPKGVTTPIS
ncbi:GMP/IMP nucleotidase [Marinimicrobium alkaliphilum]|uniref:GMP/IMP nucleotidase n=1 Tax=Marinimicrobium alkaliphilum TaxID=2202654 RepID=UPI000DB9D637|nr:GMP/IMP nucleotidase [Marinimicrobium alkaliphilum]